MGEATCRALVDELERAFLEFAEFVRELPAELYDTPVPGEEGSIRAILAHVVSAGYGHVQYVAQNCGGKLPERRFTDPSGIDDPETFVAALLDVTRFARAALGNVSDKSLETRFRSRWGQEYDGEQMMEHATCHPGRHVRQLRRFFDSQLTSP
jgi:hypothetical protein